MEERVEPGADHHPLGWSYDKTTADHREDQCQSRGDTGEVQFVLVQDIFIHTFTQCKNTPLQNYISYLLYKW